MSEASAGRAANHDDLHERLSHIRHELRTPLNQIIGYSEMLEEDASDSGREDLVGQLKKIQTGSREMLQQISLLREPSDLQDESRRLGLRRGLLSPVSQIRGSTESLLESVSGPESFQFHADLQKIHLACERLLGVIDELLPGADGTADPQAEPVREEPLPFSQSPDRAGAEATQSGSRILVVDDNDLNRDMLSQRLHREGYRVELACDGREALNSLDREPFDLVLLDVEMPVMNGYQVLEQMKSDPNLRFVPVIVISALDELEDVVHCIQLGAEDYLTKPFQPVLLKARVEKCLEKKRLHDREQAFLHELEEKVSAMVHVSNSLISTRNVEKLLEQIMELSKTVMRAEASSLFLLEEGKLSFYVITGADEEMKQRLRAITIEIGHGIAGWVAQKEEALLIPDAYADPRFDASYDHRTGFRTRSVLAVPVKVQGRLIGVVEVINKIGAASFDRDDRILFESFASLAGIAYENARLFQETAEQKLELQDLLEKLRWIEQQRKKLEKLGAYVPKQVVDEVMRDVEQALALGGHKIHATILFSDIRSFTHLSESLRDPDKVVSFLNEYMTHMTSLIEEEDGILDKFIGDGIMAIFHPEQGEDHGLRAVRCALRMQERLRDLNDEWGRVRPELGEIQCRIGINTGEVVAGNVGSETRMDFTVIGDNVNVASRIESNGVPGEVHISEATYREVSDYVQADRLEAIHVKNRDEPVQTYACRGLKTR